MNLDKPKFLGDVVKEVMLVTLVWSHQSRRGLYVPTQKSPDAIKFVKHKIWNTFPYTVIPVICSLPIVLQEKIGTNFKNILKKFFKLICQHAYVYNKICDNCCGPMDKKLHHFMFEHLMDDINRWPNPRMDSFRQFHDHHENIARFLGRNADE